MHKVIGVRLSESHIDRNNDPHYREMFVRGRCNVQLFQNNH